jgi:hypothetical protein
MMIYLFFPVLLLLTIHLQKLQVNQYATRYLTSATLSLTGFMLMAGYLGLREAPITFDFLSDYRFWVTQAGLLLFVKTQIKARKLNEKNLTVFNFANFLIDALVPFTSVLVVWFFGMQGTIEAHDRTWFDRGLMSAIIVSLLILFYRSKIKSRECNRPGLLLGNCVLGAVVLMMQGKMIQQYDPASFQAASSLIMLVVFGYFSLSRKEYRRFDSKQFTPSVIAQLVICHCVTLVLVLLIITQIPAENYTIIRNSGLVLAGYLYAQALERKKLYNWQDCLILCGIISVAVFI